MAIGRLNTSVPWLQTVEPVQSYIAGAELGMKQAGERTSLLAKHQQMAQDRAKFPLEQRARNLSNSKVVLDLAVVNEQREGRLAALDLGNETTAQNLILDRARAEDTHRTAELNWLKTENEINDMNREREDEFAAERDQRVYNEYARDLGAWSRGPDAASTPMPKMPAFETQGATDLAVDLDAKHHEAALKTHSFIQQKEKDKRGVLLERFGYQPDAVDGFGNPDPATVEWSRRDAERRLGISIIDNEMGDLDDWQLYEALKPEGFQLDPNREESGENVRGEHYTAHLYDPSGKLNEFEVRGRIGAKSAEVLREKKEKMGKGRKAYRTTFKATATSPEQTYTTGKAPELAKLPKDVTYSSILADVKALDQNMSKEDAKDEAEWRVNKIKYSPRTYPSDAVAIKNGLGDGEVYWNPTLDDGTGDVKAVGEDGPADIGTTKPTSDTPSAELSPSARLKSLDKIHNPVSSPVANLISRFYADGAYPPQAIQ